MRRPTLAPLRIACFKNAAWMMVLPLALIHSPVLADEAPSCLGPTIVTQPQSQIVTVGSNVTFFVEITGTEPLAYQWNRDGTSIPGANDPSYSILDVQSFDAGDYQETTVNPCGIALSDVASLSVIPLPFTGDYNQNGVADAADYTVWRDTLGSRTDLRANGTDEGASFGVVDLADYQIWKSHFGEMGGAGSIYGEAPAAVSEPTPVWLVAMAAMSLACMSRRSYCQAAQGALRRLPKSAVSSLSFAPMSLSS
jgi:hypothetical protein